LAAQLTVLAVQLAALVVQLVLAAQLTRLIPAELLPVGTAIARKREQCLP
jgi:hypothetical protein